MIMEQKILLQRINLSLLILFLYGKARTLIFSGQQIEQDNILKVIAIGHTSGTAMLAGIYDALFIIYRDQNTGLNPIKGNELE